MNRSTYLKISIALLSSCIFTLNGCSENPTNSKHQQTANDTTTTHPSNKSDTDAQKTNSKKNDPIEQFKQIEVVKILRSNGIEFGTKPGDTFSSVFYNGGETSDNEWNILVDTDGGTISNFAAKKIWTAIWALSDKKTETLYFKITWKNQIDGNEYSIIESNKGGSFHGKNYYTGEDFE